MYFLLRLRAAGCGQLCFPQDPPPHIHLPRELHFSICVVFPCLALMCAHWNFPSCVGGVDLCATAVTNDEINQIRGGA